MANFLEADTNLFENNLKIVKNEFADELENLMGVGAGTSTAGVGKLPANIPKDFKIVKPIPGSCLKCFKLNTNEKFFINLCQTEDIPQPDNITEAELTNILQSDIPSSFRIPMSISQPHITRDKSDKDVDVVDVAINSTFFKKCEISQLFRDFLIACVHEALNDKYQIMLNHENWIILKNRKCIGNLISHRIENRKVQKGLEMIKNLSEQDRMKLEELQLSGKKPLIQEISQDEMVKITKKADSPSSVAVGKHISEIRKNVSLVTSTIPEYKLSGKLKDGIIEEIVAKFHLPKCLNVNEILLDVGEDRILLESRKRGYLFEKFFDYSLNENKVSASFNQTNRMLTVRIGLIL